MNRQFAKPLETESFNPSEFDEFYRLRAATPRTHY